MDMPRVRPTFEVPLNTPPDEAMDVMRRRLGDDFRGCTMSAGRCMDLFVEEDQRTFWSPHLAVQLETDGPGSRLHGRYAPHPEVWTLFVFLYALFGSVALVGTGWGFSQVVLERRPLGFLLTPVAGLAMAGLYLGARIGQRRTADQMVALRARVDRLLQGLRADDEGAA